ncbi:MAG TPA: GTP-binding protein, partial [Polyangiaceae bacterium]
TSPSTARVLPMDAAVAPDRERMNIVIVGHVDHGKSTVIGRLLADTGALPEGKLDQVRRTCAQNAKPFEYAFLLDALQDEQAQGITIDAARCFFRSKVRDYIINDAPGHIEFLKNMITGASRAEAGLLVIDAKEGIKENSRRHGFMLSMLGIRQLVVLVNKMDLVDFAEARYNEIVAEFTVFLKEAGTEPTAFLPISAWHGENLVEPSRRMQWFGGGSLLDVMDGLVKERPVAERPFRMPVQDIYKFTEEGDDRRIVAGTVLAGVAEAGQEVVFVPSGKRSRISSVEAFPKASSQRIAVGQATGVTLETQLYLRPGDMMCRTDEIMPEVGTSFRASVFWLGRNPLITKKRYKLKLATAATTAYLRQVVRVMDAADLAVDSNLDRVERHQVAECILETARPIAFDLASDATETSRFVLVDDFEIAGGGIITDHLQPSSSVFEQHAEERQRRWVTGTIDASERYARYGQRPKLVLITGDESSNIANIGVRLERALFGQGRIVYYLDLSNLSEGLGADVTFLPVARDEQLRRLGEIARLFADAGCILISAVASLDAPEAAMLKVLAAPSEMLVVGVGQAVDSNLELSDTLSHASSESACVEQILRLLVEREVIVDYVI